MNRMKKLILYTPLVGFIARKIKKIFDDIRLYKITKERIINLSKAQNKKIFYLGIPAHNNLGDLAQGICIRRWLAKHYADYVIIEIETNSLVNTSFSVIKYLKQYYECDDIIVFQSGYTTTDLGGYADIMHKAVMQTLPKAKMLMMPQTIFFKSEKRKKQTADCYNNMKHMLFLARDRVSYNMATEMFPDIPVMQYPDIVTTLIGTLSFDYARNGIMFCCRDDSEKFYSDRDIEELMMKCATLCRISRTDTTKEDKASDIVRNAEKYIMKEIDTYAHYKAVITDRYHGTILSLAAGTPVIIIKTTDHKVTTGAEWFRGIYDEYVYLADNLEQAYSLAKEIMSKSLNYKLTPFFEQEYYDKLPEIFKNATMR